MPMPRSLPALPTVVRAFMFDLDGTLIDTMGGFADVAAAVMAKRHGLDLADGLQADAADDADGEIDARAGAHDAE